jgi:spermidine synthase
LCVPFLIRGVQAAYLSIAGGLDAPPESMGLTTALFHLAGSFIVLVPCTVPMGATLPLLARYAVSEDTQIGPRIGILYAINTLGAIVGTLVAAFIFLPAFGLRQTVYIGVAGNALVFVAAAALARGIQGIPTSAGEPLQQERRRFHWILPAMTISGAVSFVYEVLWTRLLGQVLGGSTAAFASMLSSFLLGIALGSAVASRFAKTRESAARGFAIAQLGTGMLAWAAFRGADLLPALTHAVGASHSSPAPGAAAAGIILLPMTVCIGATFPFGVRLFARDASEGASGSGRVYAWNTVGSILGATLTGFVFLPILGLENTAMIGVTTSLLLAIATAWFTLPRRAILATIAAASLVAAIAVGLPTPVKLLLHMPITEARTAGEFFYLGVGRSATVVVVETREGWLLRTNGLPEATVNRSGLPQPRSPEASWLSLLPAAARPEAEQILIIGLGSGQTLDAVPSTVSSIDLIELEEEVVIANRLIPRPHDPLDDPRVSLRIGDARGAMNLSRKRYDAIISQPSHPWTAGASHLYTSEFFELARSKLATDGVFVQWIATPYVDVDLFGNLIASLSDVFRYVHVYRPQPTSFLFLASDEPIDLLESAPRAIAAASADFGRYGIYSVEDFISNWVLDTEGVRKLARDKAPNTDDHNRLATTRFTHQQQASNGFQIDRILAPIDPLTPTRLRQVDAVSVLRRMDFHEQDMRALSLIPTLPYAVAQSAQGWRAYDLEQVERARTLFRESIKKDPGQTHTRAGLIVSDSGESLDPNSLTSIERTALRANRLLAAQDWQALRALDADLTEIRPDTFLFASAVRARAEWRIAVGSPKEGREAIGILDELLVREGGSDNFLLSALAAERAGDENVAQFVLELVLSRERAPSPTRDRALALADRLGMPRR